MKSGALSPTFSFSGIFLLLHRGQHSVSGFRDFAKLTHVYFDRDETRLRDVDIVAFDLYPPEKILIGLKTEARAFPLMWFLYA